MRPAGPGRGRRLLQACAWGLLLFVVADVGCRLLLPQGTLGQEEALIRGRVESEPAPDIQIVGDSVARSGLLGAAFARNGLTVRNDSVSGGGVNKTYYLLKSQFDSGRVPAVLLIAHAPHTFHQARFETLVGSFARWREIPAIARDSGDWTGVLYGLLARSSYILRHRDNFRGLVLNQDARFFTDYRPYVHVEDDAMRIRDFLARRAEGQDVPKAPAFNVDFFSRPFQLDPVNDAYLRKTLALARQHGVPVFWLSMPMPESGHQARMRAGYEAEFRKYLRGLESEGHFTILSDTFPAYPDEMFRDDVHMGENGAMRFACENRRFARVVANAAKAARKNRTGRSLAYGHAAHAPGEQRLLEPVCTDPA